MVKDNQSYLVSLLGEYHDIILGRNIQEGVGAASFAVRKETAGYLFTILDANEEDIVVELTGRSDNPFFRSGKLFSSQVKEIQDEVGDSEKQLSQLRDIYQSMHTAYNDLSDMSLGMPAGNMEKLIATQRDSLQAYARKITFLESQVELLSEYSNKLIAYQDIHRKLLTRHQYQREEENVLNQSYYLLVEEYYQLETEGWISLLATSIDVKDTGITEDDYIMLSKQIFLAKELKIDTEEKDAQNAYNDYFELYETYRALCNELDVILEVSLSDIEQFSPTDAVTLSGLVTQLRERKYELHTMQLQAQEHKKKYERLLSQYDVVCTLLSLKPVEFSIDQLGELEHVVQHNMKKAYQEQLKVLSTYAGCRPGDVIPVKDFGEEICIDDILRIQMYVHMAKEGMRTRTINNMSNDMGESSIPTNSSPETTLSEALEKKKLDVQSIDNPVLTILLTPSQTSKEISAICHEIDKHYKEVVHQIDDAYLETRHAMLVKNVFSWLPIVGNIMRSNILGINNRLHVYRDEDKFDKVARHMFDAQPKIDALYQFYKAYMKHGLKNPVALYYMAMRSGDQTLISASKCLLDMYRTKAEELAKNKEIELPESTISSLVLQTTPYEYERCKNNYISKSFIQFDAGTSKRLRRGYVELLLQRADLNHVWIKEIYFTYEDTFIDAFRAGGLEHAIEELLNAYFDRLVNLKIQEMGLIPLDVDIIGDQIGLEQLKAILKNEQGTAPVNGTRLKNGNKRALNILKGPDTEIEFLSRGTDKIAQSAGEFVHKISTYTGDDLKGCGTYLLTDVGNKFQRLLQYSGAIETTIRIGANTCNVRLHETPTGREVLLGDSHSVSTQVMYSLVEQINDAPKREQLLTLNILFRLLSIEQGLLEQQEALLRGRMKGIKSFPLEKLSRYIVTLNDNQLVVNGATGNGLLSCELSHGKMNLVFVGVHIFQCSEVKDNIEGVYDIVGGPYSSVTALLMAQTTFADVEVIVDTLLNSTGHDQKTLPVKLSEKLVELRQIGNMEMSHVA